MQSLEGDAPPGEVVTKGGKPLRAEWPVLAIIGPNGTGKSTLARAWLRRRAHIGNGMVWTPVPQDWERPGATWRAIKVDSTEKALLQLDKLENNFIVKQAAEKATLVFDDCDFYFDDHDVKRKLEQLAVVQRHKKLSLVFILRHLQQKTPTMVRDIISHIALFSVADIGSNGELKKLIGAKNFERVPHYAHQYLWWDRGDPSTHNGKASIYQLDQKSEEEALKKKIEPEKVSPRVATLWDEWLKK